MKSQMDSQMEKEHERLYRHIYCYGSLTFAMLAGMITRTAYLEFNEDEFKDHPDETALKYRFPFMWFENIHDH